MSLRPAQHRLNLTRALSARRVQGSALLSFLFCSASFAQLDCPAHWIPQTGSTGTIYDMCTLPNGDIVAGGYFHTIGGVPAESLARYHDGQWSAFGTGANETVYSLLALPDGDFLAGGSFTSIDGVPCNHIGRFTPAGWTTLSSGANSNVFAMARLPNGDIVAGGDMSVAGHNWVQNIARWDGAAWSQIGGGTDGNVTALIVLPTGDLVAGGIFAHAGSVSVPNIARWDGAAWSAIGAGFNGQVKCFSLPPDGRLVAGGYFTMSGSTPVRRIAAWNGSSWVSVGGGVGSSSGFASIEQIAVRPNGDLVATGSFSGTNFGPALNIARWDGATWSALGSGLSSPYPYLTPQCVETMWNSDIAVGGPFETAGGQSSPAFAIYTFGGTSPSFTHQPDSTTMCPSGDASFEIAAQGTLPLNYQWMIRNTLGNWTPLNEGSTELPCGGTAYASTPHASNTQIGITRCPGIFEYQVRCDVTNTCGTVNSDAAILRLCIADFNCSGGTPDDTDIAAFFDAWTSGDEAADVNGSGGTPDDADIAYFFVRWSDGC